jgi:hypothetical protein
MCAEELCAEELCAEKLRAEELRREPSCGYTISPNFPRFPASPATAVRRYYSTAIGLFGDKSLTR